MMQETKAPNGTRILEIILGLIAVIIGFSILGYPSLAIATITFLLALGLLLAGLFRLIWGFAARHLSDSARAIAIFTGLLAIVLAATVLIYPLLGAATVVILIAIGVLLYGMGRIAMGAVAGQLSGGIRGLLITSGLLMVILGLIVLIYPGLGIALLTVLLAIAFIVVGFESITAGIVGVRYIPILRESSKPILT